MQIDNPQKEYNLSRKAASMLLKVSIRTLDRYLNVKKMSTRVVGGRIWLNEDEVRAFSNRKREQKIVDMVDMSTPKMSIDNMDSEIDGMMDNVDNIEILEQESVDLLSTAKRKIRSESGTYKKLYEELKEELREKQERLEIANYRVGQLEAQVRNSIPMLEYHRENHEKQKIEEELKEKLLESADLMKKLGLRLKQAKFSKSIFLIILLIILALQPLWLLAHLNNLF